MILLDYRDKRPIYEQMVEKLENLIVSGGLEPLTKMPSVRSFAMELSVNPNTVQRAYAQLEQDGYLYTVSGRGSFVTAEEEWRENKQMKVLREWQTVTRQAKEAGISGERLSQELSGIYGQRTEAQKESGLRYETTSVVKPLGQREEMGYPDLGKSEDRGWPEERGASKDRKWPENREGGQ